MPLVTVLTYVFARAGTYSCRIRVRTRCCARLRAASPSLDQQVVGGLRIAERGLLVGSQASRMRERRAACPSPDVRRQRCL